MLFMEYGKSTLYYHDFLESRLEANRIAGLIAELIPGFPEGFEIKTLDDVHEAAIQQDVNQKLAYYYANQLELTRYAAREDDIEGPDSDLAQEYYDRAVLIESRIPVNPITSAV